MKDALRVRTAREMARMFAKGKRSKYGSPMVDGLGLMDPECNKVAVALREYAKRREPENGQDLGCLRSKEKRDHRYVASQS